LRGRTEQLPHLAARHRGRGGLGHFAVTSAGRCRVHLHPNPRSREIQFLAGLAALRAQRNMGIRRDQPFGANVRTYNERSCFFSAFPRPIDRTDPKIGRAEKRAIAEAQAPEKVGVRYLAPPRPSSAYLSLSHAIRRSAWVASRLQ